MKELPASLAGLAAYRQFICCRPVECDGKTTKLPTNHYGEVIDAQDSRNWMDAKTALHYANANGLGVGFVFTENDSLYFVDIDNCVDPNSANGWSETANNVLTYFPGAAVEVSQSGKGLHVIGHGTAPRHSSRNAQYGLEFYTSGRFVMLTGFNVVGDVNVDSSGGLAQFGPAFFPPRPEHDAGSEWTTGPHINSRPLKTDEALIKRMLESVSAAGGFGIRATAVQLWHANEHGAALAEFWPPDKEADAFNHSNADAALCQHLSFWTGGDCERIDRLFRQSDLYREKWERDDYRTNTILRAVGLCTQFYGAEKDAATDGTPSQLLFSLAEIADKARPIEWEITNYIESNANILMVGQPAAYKSFAAIDIACSVATGRPWHGHTVPIPGVVVFICGEGVGNVARRFLAWCLANGAKMADVPVVITQRPVAMIGNEVQRAQLGAEIENACQQFSLPLKLVVVDTLNRNFGAGDENKAEDVAAFNSSLDGLRRHAGASVLTIHHSGHSNGDRGRGSSALRASADAEFLLERCEGETPLGLVTMRAAKMKDAELPPAMTFQPRVVELGFDEHDGKPGTSLVLDKVSGTQVISRARTLLDAIVAEPGQPQRHYAVALGASVAHVNKLGGQLLRDKSIKKDASGRWKPTPIGINTVGFSLAASGNGE